MYSLKYLKELGNHKEINHDNILLHMAGSGCESVKDKIRLISLIHGIQMQPAIVVVEEGQKEEWEEELNKSDQLFDTLPELTSILPTDSEDKELYIDVDADRDGSFVFSFTDTREPVIQDLDALYERMARGDWSDKTASEYAAAYEELARIAGSLKHQYKKMYAKACRILEKDENSFKALPSYHPTVEENCRDIASQTGFRHPELLMNIVSFIPCVIQSLTESGDLLDSSNYPSKLLWNYHFDEIFDQAVMKSGALRLLALEDKYDEVKKAFKEKIAGV